jgi:hypothetical protein
LGSLWTSMDMVLLCVPKLEASVGHGLGRVRPSLVVRRAAFL